LAARRMSMAVSVVSGLVLAGIIGFILDVAEVPLPLPGGAAGAFLGGLLAAWLLYARRGRALVAGFLVGLFSFPVELLILMGSVYTGLYALPRPSQEISQSDLLMALVLVVIMEVIGGTAGGLVGGFLHHPPVGAVEAPRPYMPPPPPRAEKYCVQCGTGLAKETPVCPACGARQPS